MGPELVKTDHVLCPECETPTFGPYYDPRTEIYFDGHTCEDCGSTWYWNQLWKRFRR